MPLFSTLRSVNFNEHLCKFVATTNIWINTTPDDCRYIHMFWSLPLLSSCLVLDYVAYHVLDTFYWIWMGCSHLASMKHTAADKTVGIKVSHHQDIPWAIQGDISVPVVWAIIIANSTFTLCCSSQSSRTAMKTCILQFCNFHQLCAFHRNYDCNWIIHDCMLTLTVK